MLRVRLQKLIAIFPLQAVARCPEADKNSPFFCLYEPLFGAGKEIVCSKKQPAVQKHDRLLQNTYFAYSTARLSRMTLTLIWPG